MRCELRDNSRNRAVSRLRDARWLRVLFAVLGVLLLTIAAVMQAQADSQAVGAATGSTAAQVSEVPLQALVLQAGLENRWREAGNDDSDDGGRQHVELTGERLEASQQQDSSTDWPPMVAGVGGLVVLLLTGLAIANSRKRWPSWDRSRAH